MLLYRFRWRARLATMRMGIDLGGSKIEGILLADDGRERGRQRVVTPRGDYRATLTAIVNLVAQLDHAANNDETGPWSPPTIGIGIPGTISPAAGVVKNANATWLIGRPLDRDLAAALDRPVRIANDANCFAVSEAADGAAAGARVVFGVILGTGVGGGLVVDGRPLAGANAIAGEWGHNPLPWPEDAERPGPVCYCGKRGCLETFLSGPGLARDHIAHGGVALTPAELVCRAETGDAAANATLGRWESRLARGLATVINVLDPDVIVLGGGLSNIQRLYKTVPALLRQWVFSDRVDTVIRCNMHGDASGVRGAAWLWPADGIAAGATAAR